MPAGKYIALSLDGRLLSPANWYLRADEISVSVLQMIGSCVQARGSADFPIPHSCAAFA